MGGFRPAQGEEVLAKFWGKPKKERGEKGEWQEAPEVEGRGAEEGHPGHQSNRSEMRDTLRLKPQGQDGPRQDGEGGQCSQAFKPHPHQISPAQSEEEDKRVCFYFKYFHFLEPHPHHLCLSFSPCESFSCPFSPAVISFAYFPTHLLIHAGSSRHSFITLGWGGPGPLTPSAVS